MQYSCNTFCVDARRQARRAFIAFSSDDTKVKVTESEHTKDDIQNFPEQLVNDDAQTSKITPVRNFPYKSYINVIDFVYKSSHSMVEHFISFILLLGDCEFILTHLKVHQFF
jgi:hypothetical protein